MNKKLTLAVLALLGFSTVCSGVKTNPTAGAEQSTTELTVKYGCSCLTKVNK